MNLPQSDDMNSQVHKAEENGKSATEGEKKEEEENSKNDSPKLEEMSLQSKSASEGEKKDEEQKCKNDSPKLEDVDDLEIRIEELKRELEREKANQRDLKKTMRDNKDKANKETFKWKCKYEDLLKETKGPQEDTTKEDLIEIGKVQTKIVDVSVDEKNGDNKKRSSNLPEDNIETHGVENQEGIVIHGKEVREVQDRMRKNDQEMTTMNEENSRLKKENEALHQRVKNNDEEMANMKEENSRLKKENEELHQRVKMMDEKIASMEHEINRLKKEDDALRLSLSKAEGEVRCLQEQIAELKGHTYSTGRKKSTRAFMLQENQRLKEEIEDLCLRVKMKDDQINAMYQENIHLKKEDGSLRLRLSEIAGSLMINRNPSIADLSDATRPTKLAEIFSQLYDNQWTDAFEEQEGSEQKVIQHLLRILMKIHGSCQKVSSAYLSELEEKLIIIPGTDTTIFEQTADIPVTTRKFLIEIRKSVSEPIIRVLITYFRKKYIMDENKSGKEMKATAIFIDKCTELCWYMAIKDPPVILGDIPKEGEPLNKEIFKCYTRSGQHVDYCVWPPLLLYDGGPLLCKGIVQGK